jgi:hypothetical protein
MNAPPTPKNLQELATLLMKEVERANSYSNSYEGTPFASLGASPEYIRGGNAALNGVINLINKMLANERPD